MRATKMMRSATTRIREMRDQARADGDQAMVELCNSALIDGDLAAWERWDRALADLERIGLS